jgi:hypothetical protein
MVCSTHAQTRRRTGEEAAKREDIRGRSSLIPRFYDGIENKSSAAEPKGSEQMRVNIDGLIMQIP